MGFRNQKRARWDALPERQRAAISIALELLLAVLLFFIDHSLGYAVVVISALYWIHHLPRLPWQLVGQAVIVVVFLITGPRSLAATFAIAFGIFWIPQRYRRWAFPTIAIVLTVLYPFYQAKMFTIPVFGVWPDVATGVYMIVFVMMAVGLNIVVGYAGLLDLGYVAFYAMGAYTGGLVRVRAVRARHLAHRRRRHRSALRGHPRRRSGSCCRSPAPSPRSSGS